MPKSAGSGRKKKKLVTSDIACDELVRLKGFEPPTFWFVAKHSIQLSYSRMSELRSISR